MRSRRAFIGAVAILLSYPAAIAVELIFGGGGPTVIHFVAGTGFLVFATSVFDFGLPGWVSMIGAVAAGSFGAIFVVQGIVDLTHSETLQYIAFDLLGHHVERLLPDVVYLWFVALLLIASTGKSRVLGWVIMLTVVGLEAATLTSLLLGMPIPSVKLVLLLPFVWLLFEGAERRGPSVAPLAPAPSSRGDSISPMRPCP
jgi:hypothetical protein